MYCQTLYKLKWLDGVPTDDEDEDSEALVIGSAYDVYMQSVEKFNETYEIVPKRLGKSGKIELTMEQGRLIRAMAREMARQPYFNPIGEKQFHLKVKLSDYVTVSGTLDEFQPTKTTIIDDKTSAGLRKFQDFRQKYLRQVAWYAWLVWMSYQMLCDALIRMVTKEKTPKAHIYVVDADRLKEEWGRFNAGLAELEECLKTGIWATSPREKCLGCSAYASCPHSVQTELLPL